MDVNDIGCTAHTMDILHEQFEGMVISSSTKLDFLLYGFHKSQVCANKP